VDIAPSLDHVFELYSLIEGDGHGMYSWHLPAAFHVMATSHQMSETLHALSIVAKQVEIVSSLDHVNELYIVMAGHVELVPPSSYTNSNGAITSGGGASTTFGSGGGVGSGGGAGAF
jgi:uncharacterized membrane protein YgcG